MSKKKKTMLALAIILGVAVVGLDCRKMGVRNR